MALLVYSCTKFFCEYLLQASSRVPNDQGTINQQVGNEIIENLSGFDIRRCSFPEHDRVPGGNRVLKRMGHPGGPPGGGSLKKARKEGCPGQLLHVDGLAAYLRFIKKMVNKPR